MEFWGVEVKAGETVKCEPGEDRLLHLSQAALGETKSKGAERVPIYVNFNDQKLVLGTLSAEKCTQISYDLVFEKEFELFHGSKNASVYFTGYKSDLPEDDEYLPEDEEFPGDFDESDSEEDVPVTQNANGALKVKSQEEKPPKAKSNVDKVDNAAAKSKAKAGKPVKAEPNAGHGDDEDDSDSEDNDYSEESDDDVDMMEAMGDSDDDEDIDEDEDEDEDDDDDEDDESSEEEDEDTPKKSANGKKKPAKAASKTSAPEKKAKLTAPASGQKTGGDGKNGTPGKQLGKGTGKQ